MKQRKIKCPDFFNCSLPKEEQIPSHMTRYHDAGPVFITNPILGRPPLKIQRDPARGMYYPCPHPKCDHISILKTDPRQHQLVCEYRDRTRFNRPPAPDPSAPKRPRGRPIGRKTRQGLLGLQGQQQLKQQQRRRAVPRHMVYQHSSLQPRSATPVASQSPVAATASSLSGTRRTSRTMNDITGTKLDQILSTMDQLTKIITGLGKEMDEQTVGIDAIGDRMDWLTDQIDQIRGKNANLEDYTESLRINAGLVEDHLGDLLKDNRKVKEQFRSVQEDVGRMRAMTKGLRQQDGFQLEY